MTVDDLDGAVFALGRVGAGLEVLSPPEPVERAHAWGRRRSAVESRVGGR